MGRLYLSFELCQAPDASPALQATQKADLVRLSQRAQGSPHAGWTGIDMQGERVDVLRAPFQDVQHASLHPAQAPAHGLSRLDPMTVRGRAAKLHLRLTPLTIQGPGLIPFLVSCMA